MTDTKKLPTKGQRVYSIDGQAGVYVARITDGHVVEPLHTHDEDEGEFPSGIMVWREVYDKPPTTVLEARIAELDAEIERRTDRVAQLRAEETTLLREAKERLARLKQHEGLALLDDYLAGRVTHYVVREYGNVQVMTFAEAVARDEGGYRQLKKPRLLTLFGDSAGNLQWGLSCYASASSSNIEAWPCTSREQALKKAQELIDEIFADWRRGDGQWKHYCSSAVDASRKLGLPVPADAEAYVAAGARAVAEKKVADAEKALTEARAALAAQRDGAA